VPADDLSTPAGQPADDGRADRAGTLVRGIRVVWMGVRQEPGIFALAVGGATVYGAATAAGGYLLGRITDRVLTPAFAARSISGSRLALTVGVLVAVAVLTAAGVVVRRAAAGMAMYRLQARYRRDVTRAYLRLPLSWHHRHPTGQLLSNANADVEAMWQVIAPLPMGLGVIVLVLVAMVAMLLADPVLAVVGLLVIPAVIWLNAIYQRRMSPLVTRAQQLRAEVSAVAHESFDAAVVVKVMGREGAETGRFAVAARQLRDANVAVGRLRGLFDPAIEALPTLGTLAVLVIGTVRVKQGQAGTGDVVQVAYLLSLLAFPVRAIGWVLGELPRSVVGWARVSAVLQARGELDFGTAELPGRAAARLELDRIDYAYTGADGERLPVLHGITLDVPPGRTVAVVGPTGSGKSTLATLMVRLVDPDHGRVLLDGVDLRELPRGGVAAAAALVPQATFVFHDTVLGNVALGDPEIDERQVWHALRLVRADRFVAELPNGLHTMVGERGATLSGGQRQRLALARAVVRRPRLLVLDDATSVVVVAYRKATIALADEIAYVEHGRLVARGRHDQLMAGVDGYRQLVTAYERDAEQRRTLREAGSLPVQQVRG
jgi:ATP-binding cassette, subfamily B, bacterial